MVELSNAISMAWHELNASLRSAARGGASLDEMITLLRRRADQLDHAKQRGLTAKDAVKYP
ncbi:hypothetical protein [Paracoccus sp. (in: a-proteobacteria)]|uniref:hypothetical protein n=1 Tax=Paracoccus sp. TaxID=267 RepID=UPI0026E0FEDD|nr:hypothetical protein [Paracoccus sp. (in: a-proteobacteria)]MDO5648366.1 hypothetical protein [Paracoccus sp. (in: a-proteobacteria)]